MIALFLTFLLGEVLVPPYLQRLLIGKRADQAARGTLYAGLFSIPFFAISGLIGLVALAIDPTLTSNLSLPHVVMTTLPPVLRGLVIAGIIAVVMSSADSFLNSASIAFVNDLVRPLGGANLSARTNLLLAKAAALTVGVLSVAFAVTIESLLDILIFAYTYWAPVVVVALVATLLGYPRSTRSFAVGAAGGLLAASVWNEMLGKPLTIEGFVVGVLVNAALFVLLPAPRSPGSAAASRTAETARSWGSGSSPP
jgi:SSS family solute:Na+ symporter